MRQRAAFIHALAFFLALGILYKSTSSQFRSPSDIEPAYGRAMLEPQTDVLVRSKATWTITYTVGEKGLTRGGKLRIGYSHLISDMGALQIHDPKGANYLRIVSSKPLVRQRRPPSPGQMFARFRIEWGNGPQWDGKISISGGRLLSLVPYRFEENTDRIEGESAWRSVAQGLDRDGMEVEAEGPGSAKIEVRTSQGDFSFTLQEILSARELKHLGGRVRIWQPMNLDLFRGPSHDYYVTIANENEPLVRGDTIEVILGDKSSGGPGMQVQSYDERDFIFEVSVDPDGKGVFHLVANLKINIVGDKAKKLLVFVPSLVKAGEPFSVAVKAEDDYSNLSPSYRGTVRLAWESGRGELPSPYRFTAKDRGIHVFSGLKLTEPGIYYLSARDFEGKLSGASNPIKCVRKLDERIYWGELHGHTGLSDGRGTADNFYDYARNVARMDFAAMTDHDIQNKFGIEYMWQEARRAAKRYNDEGEFVTYLAWEWSGPTPQGGDHNTFYMEDNPALFPVRPITRLWKELDKLKGIPAMTIPHVGGRIGNWDFHNERYQRLAELYSDHGMFEWFLQEALRRGYRVGVVAASDDHQGHPGYSPVGSYWNNRGGLTAVYALKLTRQSIWEGLYARRCYGTSGPRIYLDFKINGHHMGESFVTSEPPTIQVEAAGIGPLLQIDIVKNGETIYSHNIGRTAGSGATKTLRLLWGHDKDTRGYGTNISEGDLKIEDGELLSAQGLHFESQREGLQGYDKSGCRWRFTTERGDIDGLLLEVRGTGETECQVRLADKAARFRLSDLDRAHGEWQQILGESLTVIVAEVSPRAPRTASFSFQDRSSSGRATDYYYVRLVQIDGEMAWTSPIWVDHRN